VDLDSAVDGIQTFSGNKTFSDDVTFDGITTFNANTTITGTLDVYKTTGLGRLEFTYGSNANIIIGDDITANSIDVNLNNTIENVFIGLGAGEDFVQGNGNNFIGFYAGKQDNPSGSDYAYFNNIIGYYAAQSLTSGSYNQGMGEGAINSLTSGDRNIAIGNYAGFAVTTGDHNILLGDSANVTNGSDSYNVVIGKDITVDGNNNLAIGINGEKLITGVKDGSVDLYHNNLKKFETTADGVTVTGDLDISGKIIAYSNGNLAIGPNGGTNPKVFFNNNGTATFENTVIADGTSLLNDRFVVRTINDKKLTVIGDGTVDIGGTPGTAPNIRLNADGSATFGQASNSTNNNGILLGADVGQFNLYTTRYSTDAFQILNTSGSGTNVAVRFDGDGDATFAGTIDATGFTISGSPIQTAVATTSSVGTVQPDGTTIGIDANGVISVTGGGDPFTANGFKFGVNEATGPAATLGEFRQISGKPYFYDGTAWQEFILGSTQQVTIPAETAWDQVLIRSTFDSDFDDVKFGAVGNVNYSTAVVDATLVGAPVKVGTNSLKSNGDGVLYPHRSDYDFTGTWTIEFWIYFDSDGGLSSGTNNGEQEIVSKANATFDAGSWAIITTKDQYANRSWRFKYHDVVAQQTYYKTIVNVAGVSWNPKYNQEWVHVAFTHESDGTLHVYENGLESSSTYAGQVTVNDIDNNSHDIMFGGGPLTRSNMFDGFIDDLRVTKDVRYTGNGTFNTLSFNPPTTQHPISGTTTTFTPPPTSKAGEITLGATPTWTGTAGVTVTQQSSGNYRMTFTNPFTNATDYYVFTNHMDYIGGQVVFVKTTRSNTHIDFVVYREGDGANVDTGSIAVQVIAH
jgi:hypothetical protein